MADERCDFLSSPWRGPWWRGPYREALVRRYLECAVSGGEDNSGAVMAITAMTFMASAEEQWEILLEMVREAPEEAFGAVAAGPLEGFLGRFGESFIDRVED